MRLALHEQVPIHTRFKLDEPLKFGGNILFYC